jgi:hypothetical protein
LVGISAYPEFFRENLELCIGISPIMKLDNLKVDYFVKNAEN